MLSPIKRTLAITTLLTLAACASNGFVSSWKAPDAAPLEMRATKVAALVMMSDGESRRAAEESLAREISAHGATGIPMYTLLPEDQTNDEQAARQALATAGVSGAVVMRPISVEKELSTANAMYSDPMHRGLWGGYYGHGWSSAWGPTTTAGELSTDTIVVVETLVYSVKQNKLVWGGQSRTTNPKDVDQLVHKLASAAANELEKLGLLQAPAKK
jgi:hypothetical protein